MYPNPAGLALWPHQSAAVGMCDAYFAAAAGRAALVQLPTGTGKTGVMATIASRRAADAPVLVVCPSAALVDQIMREVGGAFWQRVGAPDGWTPERVEQLLPSTVDQLVGVFDDPAAGRIVVVGTIQALQQLHASGDRFAPLVGRIGTVLFDEGHREPAPAWAAAVRELGAPTVLFSATPFRNDLKIFAVDLDHVSFLSFEDAVAENLVRAVSIVEEPLPSGFQAFAAAAVALRDARIDAGDYGPDCKMIVRAADALGVRGLFAAFSAVLGDRPEGVLAMHNTFDDEGADGRFTTGEVPADLRNRTERFLIHQFMLTEGIDDPACTIVALHDGFSTERQMVQQVGRVIRHPQPGAAGAAPALVAGRVGIDLARMWDGFLKFDRECVAQGGRPPLRNDQAILHALINDLPGVDYVEGRFRARLNLNGDLADDLRVPYSTTVFTVAAGFDLEEFRSGVSAALFDDDRTEVMTGEIAEGACRYHLSFRLCQTPFLGESLFQVASVEATIYSLHGSRLFFYDSAGLWVDEAGIAGREGSAVMRSLLPDDPECVITQIAMVNTDLGPSAVRSRSFVARSVDRAGVFVGEHLHVVTRAAARLRDGRRSVSFSRGRVREKDGARATPVEFYDWTAALGAELHAAPEIAPLFRRFALPTARPPDTSPRNILVDLDAFVGEYRSEDADPTQFELDSVCQDVRAEIGPEDFRHSFDLMIDGAAVKVWIRWDRKKARYWLRSDELSRIKLKENENISLARRLNQRQPFRIIPGTPAMSYAYGQFYRANFDLAQAEGAGRLVLNLVTGVPGLELMTSEKGDTQRAFTSWPQRSLFEFVDTALTTTRRERLGQSFPNVICDDLGQEAGDFIAVDDGGGVANPRAVLVAAKWKAGNPGVSASALYDVCAQIVKNLAYMKVDAQELPGSTDHWDGDWVHRQARVARIRAGGDAAAFRLAFRTVRGNPSCQRQLWMVLGGGILSKAALEAAFLQPNPEPHVLQFYHLVLSTYSACVSVGADLRIFCAE